VESGGSYRLREHFEDVEVELARLEAQASYLWSKEVEVLRRRGLPVDGPVLEIGCGPGFITERLLELAGDGGVTAVDNDPEMVALATRRLASVERVRVLEASVQGLPFPDDAFAAATARLVFQHLPDPTPALTELRRVLASRGRLFITDIDGGWPLLLDPEPPHLAEVTEAVDRLRGERGGNPKIGRLLPRLLLSAGFSDIAVDAVTLHSIVDGRQSVSEIIAAMPMLEQLAAHGLISPTVLDDLRAYSEQFERGELEIDGLLGMLVVSGST
jgi:SAM-dependent methyltransferase